MFNDKRGVELGWNAIILIVIGLVAAVIIIAIFSGQADRTKGVAGGFIDDVDADCDGDGTRNIIDRCACSIEEATPCPASDPTAVSNCPERCKA